MQTGFTRAWPGSVLSAASVEAASQVPPSAGRDRIVQNSVWKDYLLAILPVLLIVLLTRMKIRPLELKWAFIGLSIACGLIYLYWRAAHTLNTSTPLSWGLTWTLYIAEIYGFLSMLLFYIQAASPADRVPPIPRRDADPSVDVFITTVNESSDILYKTLVACKALDYPAGRLRIIVLDDGQRSEVRRLAEQLECGYLGRPTHEHAKAGNLNYGLAHSSGQFVMVLDCDHVPVRSFLQETIGFFEDGKVAFVQTPHYFYNPDTYQRNLRMDRQIVNEQDLFFFVIQPGRDQYNSSFFAGSGGLFRRSALDEIGGFQTLTLTEDLHTSMVLHAKGHRSIYRNKILAAGLSPESYRSYLRQRQRWTRGGIQVFLLDNPLWKPGLTLMQRIQYFGSIFYFFHGAPRLIFLSAPLAYLFAGIPPVVAPLPVLIAFYLPYYATSLMAFNRISRGHRNPFWSDVYETVMAFFITWTAMTTIFTTRKSVFHVTPKGERFEKARLDWSHVAPHLFLTALLITGLVLGALHLWHGTANRDALMLSTIWTTYNLIILVAAIVVAREAPQRRGSSRLSRRIACVISFGGRALKGVTHELSETGFSMKLERFSAIPPLVQVQLTSEFGEQTELGGELIRNDAMPEGEAYVGIRFLSVNDEQRRGLIRQMYSAPSSWDNVPRPVISTWRSFESLATSPVRPFLRETVLRRNSPRIPSRMACEVVMGDRSYRGYTEDLGHAGASVSLAAQDLPAKEVILRIFKASRQIFSIRGEIARQVSTKNGITIYGIRFLERRDFNWSSLTVSD